MKSTTKIPFKVLTIGAVLAGTLSASAREITVSYPAIYPFVPTETSKIYGDITRVTEDKNFIRNFNEIIKKKLSKARTKDQPWTASYWPLTKGTIADPYEESTIPYYVDWSWVYWKKNYKDFNKRYKNVLKNVDSMSEKELALLAPSEKYDLLIGDKNFDLTRRLWDYMKKWGSQKQNAFITKILLTGEDSLDLAKTYVGNNWYTSVDQAFKSSWNLSKTLSAKNALQLVKEGKYSNATRAFDEALEMAEKQSENYVLEKKNSLIAGWEGICNGWSTAAGLVPRPRKSVSFKLPNGKSLKFYPSDIRGLVSLYYVNSLIQDSAMINEKTNLPTTQGTVSAGLRCNLEHAKKDLWGRKYDHKDDPFSGKNKETGKRDARCAGVHPATWHLGLVNLIGHQKRSFVVERKVGHAVDNHPMYKYEMKYFNPNNGWAYDELDKNIEQIDEKDQFKQFRNKKAKYIVGVQTVMTYMDYAKPTRKETNSEKDDLQVDKKMYYDLELDSNFNIVGGQWRAVKHGQAPSNRSSSGSMKNRLNHNQPDFFWTITKDYKKLGWFDDEKGLVKWKNKSVAPPRSWIAKAHEFHSFNYNMDVKNGNVATCRMLNQKTGKFEKVFCEQSYNRPQPLINVVNALVNLAK